MHFVLLYVVVVAAGGGDNSVKTSSINCSILATEWNQLLFVVHCPLPHVVTVVTGGHV